MGEFFTMLKNKHYKQINELIVISNDIELMRIKFKVEDEISRRRIQKNLIKENLPRIL